MSTLKMALVGMLLVIVTPSFADGHDVCPMANQGSTAGGSSVMPRYNSVTPRQASVSVMQRHVNVVHRGVTPRYNSVTPRHNSVPVYHRGQVFDPVVLGAGGYYVFRPYEAYAPACYYARRQVVDQFGWPVFAYGRPVMRTVCVYYEPPY